MSMVIVNGSLTPMNHESVSVDDTVGGVALTATKYFTHEAGGIHTYAVEALITAETAETRWTVDGTAPTTTVGHLLSVGSGLLLQGTAAITAFRAIKTGGTNATFKVTYFKR